MSDPLTVLAPSYLAPLSDLGEISWFEETPDDSSLERAGFFIPLYMGSSESLEVMRRMPRLQVCQSMTIGFEVALPYLPVGVTLCNAAGVHEASTAELAIGLILANLRGIDVAARAMPEGRWVHERRDALADRDVLIIGAGGVGSAIATRLAGFEARVTLIGRTARDGVAAAHELPNLLPTADVIVLAVPLDDETAGMVDDLFLARMKDGALLVNVSRGGVVDTEALLAEVSTGRLRASLDVTDPEPLPAEHPLWRAPGVLITPHVGGNSSTFLPRARRLAFEQVGRWRAGTPLQNIVRAGGRRA